MHWLPSLAHLLIVLYCTLAIIIHTFTRTGHLIPVATYYLVAMLTAASFGYKHGKNHD